MTMAAVPGQSQHNHPMAQELHAQELGSHLLGWCWEPSAMVFRGPWGQGLQGCLPVQRLECLGSKLPQHYQGGTPQNEGPETAGTAVVTH